MPDLATLLLQTKDEDAVPLTINCWPSASGGESFVNIEYESRTEFDLQNVVIAIPCHQPPRITQVGFIGHRWIFPSAIPAYYWEAAWCHQLEVTPEQVAASTRPHPRHCSKRPIRPVMPSRLLAMCRFACHAYNQVCLSLLHSSWLAPAPAI